MDISKLNSQQFALLFNKIITKIKEVKSHFGTPKCGRERAELSVTGSSSGWAVMGEGYTLCRVPDS